MTRGPWRSCAIAFIGLVFLCGIFTALLSQPAADAANPAFVQARSKQITTGTVNSLPFTNANGAGNLILVYVVWDNSSPVTLRDSRGNTYASVAPPTAWGANGTWRSQLFYAKSIASGTNTVTATFQGAITSFGRLYIHEYSGLDRTAPLDVSSVSTGTTRAMDSGPATTTNANDVIFGAGSSTNNITAAGAGFTTRLNANRSRTEDKTVTTAGPNRATATQNGTQPWVMHMAAFKVDASDGSAPTPVSGSRVDLTWTASTDDVGVVGYRIFRNGTQVADITATSYSDTGLSDATTYNYTVRAYDAADNTSAASNTATATTLDTTPPSVPANLAAQAISSTQVNLSWSASSDNAGVTGYKIFRDGTLLTTIPGTSYQDTGRSAATTYSYTVLARDAAENESAQTPAVTATTPAPDTSPPGASVMAPAAGSVVSGSVTVSATATDNVGVAGVRFLLDGAAIGSEDTTAPYSMTWDTTTVPNGVHTLQARARDTAGNLGTSSSSVTVTVSNSAPPPTPGLVGGWSFNENIGTTVNDVSGNANTATVQGNPAWTLGRYGGGLRFDGTGDYLTAPNSPTLNISGSAMTLSMWVNPLGSGGGDQVVFAKFWGAMSSSVYQYALELHGGRTPHFYIGTADGLRGVSMGTPLALSQWSHLAIVFNGSQAQFYVNGNLVSSPPMSETISARASFVHVAADVNPAQFFNGTLDDVRLYSRAETALEVMADMNRPLSAGPADTTAPGVSVTSPAEGDVVTGARTLQADASDDVGVAGVQFFVDGNPQGPEDTVAPYAANWDTRATPNGAHVLAARARDTDNKTTVSTPVNVTVANTDTFQNEVLSTGFDLPTAMKFLPDGRLLLTELGGKILVLPPPYTTPNPTPFLQITNIPSTGVQAGIFDLALDPNFAANHYFYVFYTTATPGSDRLSRFTANSALTGTVPGSELVLYQDPERADTEHHGGAITFGNDGMIYFTTGDHFQGTPSQNLNSPRGKIHRIWPDGLVPTDNPFYDGSGPHWDSVWAYGLRNPFRAYYDRPTGRLFVGDVGGNVSESWEEVDLGARAANYGWPDVEGPCSAPCTNPLYSYPRNASDGSSNGSSITGGFVYHGTQFPSGMQGNYFFADYTGRWIKRMALDSNGNFNGVFNFEPLTGNNSAGDIVYLIEGPDGALYYLDLGYADTTGTFGISKLRRIRYLASNQAPVALASANKTSGPAPLAVQFSSAGSNDPEGQPITYSWDFGDGSLSTAANPSHTFASPGQYVVRLAVSDGENSSISTPLTISVGSPPTATITAPTDGASFRAGDVISYSGDATDPDDGNLPASAYAWNIDFLHDTHVHPGTAISGVKSGTFVIPTSGHDFEGNTRYRITLTVTDANGLRDTRSVIVSPQKVNLSFDTSPSGLTVYVDGVAHTTPFVLDTLVGFNHTIDAREQTSGGNTYTFTSWSDGAAQSHTITAPSTAQSYTASYSTASAPSGVMAAWGFNEPSGTTTADVSGNNNTATLLGGPTRVAGKYGNALSFDQVNDYLSVPNSSSLNFSGTAATLSMWINPGSLSGDSMVLGKFWNTNMSSPYYQYGLELSGGRPHFYIGTSTGLMGVGMDSALALNQWTHLAVVFNGLTTQFFVNGTMVSSKSLLASITARGMALRMGADASPWQFYKGLLDNVRVYNRALSATEVTTDMNSGL